MIQKMLDGSKETRDTMRDAKGFSFMRAMAYGRSDMLSIGLEELWPLDPDEAYL